jgi:hypothetical protein
MDIRPDDRVLLTSLDSLEAAGVIAAALTRGSLVGLGNDEQVRAARRLYADLDHVMFTAGSREEIPWRDQSFTLVVDAAPEEPTAEIRRVLFPGGRIAALPATESPAA